MQTERVTFLTTPDHKAALTARAAAQRVSLGEYVRRKTVNDEQEDLTPAQEAELAALVAEVNEAVPKMMRTLDEMSETLQRTHEEVDRLLRDMGARS